MTKKRKFIHRQTWFVRRGEKVEGPFPALLVSRYILVGRIKPDHEVSVDGRVWSAVSEFPELSPEILQIDESDPIARQRLMAAIRWEDERSGNDRRGDANAGSGGGKRSGRDRREISEAKRTQRTARLDAEKVQRTEKIAKIDSNRRWQFGVFVALLVAGGVLGIMFIKPESQEPPPDCSLAPKVGVNWRLCSMEGVQLGAVDLTEANLRSSNFTGANLAGASLQGAMMSYAVMSSVTLSGANLRRADLTGVGLRNANLTGANFENANLAYVDLTGATIDNAQFDGAILDKAIWVDRRVCAVGSVGRCQ